MRALVVDDEPPALAELTWLLEQDGRFSSVQPASSGTDALRALEEGAVDVVFSDISMPGLDGMELARVIARFADRPQVVFVTAHEEHAVDAFAVQATDYLLKPVSRDRLTRAVDRVLGGMPYAGSPAPVAPGGGLAGAAPADAAEPADERIAVELGGVTRFVRRSDVRYVQAQGDYARLFTQSGSHLIRVPLSTLEERWTDAGFVRIHRSTLVALGHVAEVRQSQGKLSLVLSGDGPELAVARRHAREVRRLVVGE
ncbi:LytR/AlgR family response regulator transcription factor [Ornithinimicrobium tianjinense]|uniref:DNA-binding response regulator n=1 Tax=Ornithinimicrobium tianjinense TaxID=1195761 RepID=A0A917BYW9_9MICO|nr:LytTR family DNA-binding domain-containing protein [Ornithinimicrobium tianjinense]GGF60166.1 DNA-binding response regulator [Ornithinimicrobium tianjinense]